MMERAWALVAVTLLGTVAGQMLLKVAIERRGPMPTGTRAALAYVGGALLDPLVILSLALAFVAALAWIGALSRLSLSVAYPFMALAFVFTTLLSSMLLGESVGGIRWTGIALVTLGLVMVARG